jgi:two-component system response regulator NreC
MKTRIVIVDDHDIVVQGLKLFLQSRPDVEIVGEATEPAEVLPCIEKTKPDLVIMDMDLPNSNGVLLSREIFSHNPKTKVIIFSAHVEPHYVTEAINAGVSGYLGKIHRCGELDAAVETVMKGQIYLCAEAASVLTGDYRKKSCVEALRLTDREREVLKAIASGLSTKEIAANFGVSVKTIETNRQNIMKKLEVHSVAELTKYAIRQGLAVL